MPRTASIQIAGAPIKTRWTLEKKRQDSPVQSPPTSGGRERKMQANGNYFAHQRGPSSASQQQYNGYHTRQSESTSSSRMGSSGWGQPNGVSPHEDYGYHSRDDQRESYQISVNTQLKRRNTDLVGQHLLYETAMMDSQAFEILDIGEVDALKKEHSRLNSRIDGAQRKLALESKMKDAAQNLQRLYSTSAKGRPDTPQSPESPKRSRSSLLGRGERSNSGGAQNLVQADNELAVSVKKVDELHEQVRQLLERRQYVERKLLRHTAAVLAEQANKSIPSAVPGMPNGHRGVLDDDDSVYTPDDFDGIRDILHGMPAGASIKVQQHEQQMEGLQDRLEQLNSQLRTVINEAGRTLGKTPASETPLDHSEDSTARVENRIARLEDNLHALEEQQQDVKLHYARIQSSEYESRNAIEQQLAELSVQLHGALLLASEEQGVPGLQQPPEATGHGYQGQVQYLEESLMTMEQLLQQHSHALQSARDAGGGASKAIDDAHANAAQQVFEAQERAAQQVSEAQELAAQQLSEAQEQAAQQVSDAQTKASQHQQKATEYETTVIGLWEILQMDSAPPPSPRPDVSLDSDDPPVTPRSPMQESFSLQAFSARVQHLFDRAQSAKEQHEILRRQIQQQRELNGKSDAEKDRQFAELSETHRGLNQQHESLAHEHGQLQQELANAIVAHQQADEHANASRTELMNVMNEVEEMKKTIDARAAEKDDVATALQTHQANTAALQEQIAALEQQVQELTDEAQMTETEASARTRQVEEKLRAEMEGMEGEVVRLTTELTMAKADLDVAYGSRAERAGAQAGEVSKLEERNAQLARELEGMTAEFAALTRESLELERERGQLDALIDGLRERVEGLEAQLGDERVRALGARSPAAGGERERGATTTSTMVLRQEFKRMMRDARAEGVRLLRVCLVPVAVLEETLLTCRFLCRPSRTNAAGWSRSCGSCASRGDRWRRGGRRWGRTGRRVGRGRVGLRRPRRRRGWRREGWEGDEWDEWVCR